MTFDQILWLSFPGLEKTHQIPRLSRFFQHCRHPEDVSACLQYLNDTGLILWQKDDAVLANYIFHDLEFLISIFKSIFHHTLEESLDYTNNKKLQKRFGEQEYSRALTEFQQ